jgi:hypothetical protein
LVLPLNASASANIRARLATKKLKQFDSPEVQVDFEIGVIELHSGVGPPPALPPAGEPAPVPPVPPVAATVPPVVLPGRPPLEVVPPEVVPPEAPLATLPPVGAVPPLLEAGTPPDGVDPPVETLVPPVPFDEPSSSLVHDSAKAIEESTSEA